MEKSYRVIKEGNKKYILASQVPDYAKEHFKTVFGIPSYRTLRLYVQKGVLPKPKKIGRESFLELQVVLNFIELWGGH